MFGWISGWFRRQREWHADHKRAWAGQTEVDASGTSQFQRTVLAHLETAAPVLVFNKEGGQEAFFVAPIPNSNINVFVFPDGIQVLGKKFLMRSEEWDHRTPGEMIDELISVLRSRGCAT
jgi:hypothetical protein